MINVCVCTRTQDNSVNRVIRSKGLRSLNKENCQVKIMGRKRVLQFQGSHLGSRERVDCCLEPLCYTEVVTLSWRT